MVWDTDMYLKAWGNKLWVRLAVLLGVVALMTATLEFSLLIYRTRDIVNQLPPEV